MEEFIILAVFLFAWYLHKQRVITDSEELELATGGSIKQHKHQDDPLAEGTLSNQKDPSINKLHRGPQYPNTSGAQEIVDDEASTEAFYDGSLDHM